MCIERSHRNRLITYLTFRSAADVHRFAKEKLHRLYWDEFNKTGEAETEIFHELVTVSSLDILALRQD